MFPEGVMLCLHGFHILLLINIYSWLNTPFVPVPYDWEPHLCIGIARFAHGKVAMLFCAPAEIGIDGLMINIVSKRVCHVPDGQIKVLVSVAEFAVPGKH